MEKVIPLTTTSMHNTTICVDDEPKEMVHIANSLNFVMNNVRAASESNEGVVPEEVQRLLEKYGATMYGESAGRIPFVIRTDKNMAFCEGCKGAPCKRPDFDSYLNNVPNIKVSEDKLVIRWESCEYQKAYSARKKLEKGWHKAKMPKRYFGKTFADYKVDASNSAAVKAAKEFITSGEGGLIFYGNPGTGKTLLASIVTQEFLKADKSVIFGDVPTLLEALRDSFDDKKTKITGLMDDLAAVDLLVLDDLGTEVPTEWAVERLYSIINQRYNEEKPVIVTSNLELGKLAWRLNHPKKTYSQANNDEKISNVTGSRIVSRLAQMCTRVELKGADRRF